MVTAAVLLAGALLVALVLADVLLTVFHPTAHAGPLTRVQSRSVWRLTRFVGRCRGRPNDRILTLGGPAIAALTPILWVAILIVGFAFIHWPFVLSFSFDPGPAHRGWLQAFYYSGYLATTLGLGDVVPLQPVFRMLAILEAFIGFGLFSVGITYVVSIYTQQSVQTALANDIDHALAGAAPIDWDGEPSPQELEWSYSLAREFAHRLARVTTANNQYPILHYFRQSNPADALAVQVGRLIRWVQAMEAASGKNWLRSRSPFLSLRRSVDSYLRQVPGHLLPGERSGGPVDWDRQHRALLRYLCYDDVPPPAAPGTS